MIEQRVRKSRRLLAVQQDLQRIEEERVAGLKRRQVEISTLQQEAIDALSADEALQGVFTSIIVKRLQALGEEKLRIDAEMERRLRILQAAAARTKYAEKLNRGYEQQRAKTISDKELMDVIERALRIDDASLP